MNRPLRTGLALGLALLATVAGSALPATAAPADDTPPVTLGSIQTAAQLRITQRLSSLDEATTRVAASRYLDEADRSAILATLGADSSGLTALGATIAADTDRATAAAHFSRIFTDYRIYGVAIPQAAYAAAADALTGSALPALVTAHDRLAASLAASDTSTPELEATLADMQSQLDAAAAAISGIAARALAVTPADYNANPAVLADERAAVATATAAARQARVDGVTIAKALR